VIDHDARQLGLMLERLDAFDRKEVSLGKLVSSLNGLLSALQDADERWKKDFLRQWGLLEDVHANALDKSFGKVPSEHLVLVGPQRRRKQRKPRPQLRPRLLIL
jgi:hypothetical protein